MSPFNAEAREAARLEALREIDGFDLGAHEHQHGVEAFSASSTRVSASSLCRPLTSQ